MSHFLLTLLTLHLFASPKPAEFTEHLVAAGLTGGYQVVIADMNNDGKPDLIALASGGMSDLIWFENPTWKRHVIAADFNHMVNVAAWDIDGDRIPVLVLAHEFANQAKNSIGVLSVLTHGEDPAEPWTAKEIDRFPTSHRLRWVNVDGSGRKVLISTPLTGEMAEAPAYRGKTPIFLYRPGDWIREMISDENEGVAHGMYVCDWDGNGREAILSASFSGIHLFRLGFDRKWTRTELAKGDPSPWPQGGSGDVAVGRTPRTRFLAAIEPWHGNQVAIYNDKKGAWQRNVIDSTLVNGHTILTADLNGDGIDEVIAGYRGPGRSVNIYYATSANADKWTKTVLDNGNMAASSCAVGDLNGDGRPDIACIGSATANLKWYENKK